MKKQMPVPIAKGTLAALTLVLMALQVGCASLFADSTDDMRIESEPAGAKVFFKGDLIGKTPLQTRLARQMEAANAYITLKLDGYESKTVRLERTVDGKTWFNFGFLTTTSGAPSFGTDVLTGKMFKYSRNAYVVELEAVKGEGAEPPPEAPAKDEGKGKGKGTGTGTGKKKSRDSSANGSALEYTIVQYERLRSDLSRGRAEDLRGYCAHWSLTSERCASLMERLRGERANLLAQPHSLAFYRQVKRISDTL